MDGISAITEEEHHQKRLRSFVKARFLLSPGQYLDPNVFSFCSEECCDYIQGVQDQYIRNKQIPQIIDIKYL